MPPGLVAKQDGSVDEEYYTKTQGFHPDFVKELKAAMQGVKPYMTTASATQLCENRTVSQTHTTPGQHALGRHLATQVRNTCKTIALMQVCGL